MGQNKKATKRKKNVEESAVEFVCTIEPELQSERQHLEDTEHQSEELQNHEESELPATQNDIEDEKSVAENADEGINDNPVDDTESELPVADNEQETHQTNRKKKRGPIRMKYIAKDPNTREKVEYNEMGEAYGRGSVKLASYVGCFVREHVPVLVDDWRMVSADLKTVLWKSIQARFELDEEYQKTSMMSQMGCLWRCFKSRLVTKIRKPPNNQARMNMRPKNIPINDWRKFIILKTSNNFKVVNDNSRNEGVNRFLTLAAVKE
ncbi:PREDICTED: uncharacterized protein LOC109130121 [Camelina sativa]|uniref:Uncharacterized protein LOC109130121 n=1 Tax=Camelina sativa TaxID=90675 RepID=A0ABM1R792_CAMSA|nr:PREDICTED: uncharacterized protein LOC109130121 [Camelina sativa]